VAELRPDVTLEQVREFLTEKLGRTPEELRALKPGEHARAYAFDDRVIRFGTTGEPFEADRVAHERFGGPGLPIPRVFELGRFGELHYAISERLPGRIMWDLTPDAYNLALPALLDVHDRIAAIDPSEGFGPKPWRAYLDEIGPDHDQPGFWHGWRSLFETSFLERDLWEGLHGRFRALLPAAQDPGRLVHGDFGQDNVLIEGPRITAVLDWNGNKRGDPLWDLAYIAFWARWIRPALDARYGHLPDYAARMQLYQLRVALDSLRFYARTGARPAYDWIKERIGAL
jgi:hygromycin-B 4-O-kinase